MNRKLLFLGIGIVYFIAVIYGLRIVYSAGDTLKARAKEAVVVKPDNKIAIAHTEIFGNLERPQVIFDHQKHVEAFKNEGCNACHPVNDKGNLLFDFPKKIEKKDKTSVMTAYHDACFGCHKKRGIEKKKGGPVICADCHKNTLEFASIRYPVFEFDFSYHDEHVKKLKEKIGKDDCGQCHHTYNLKTRKLEYKEGTEESCYYCHDLVDKQRGAELSAVVRQAARKGLSMQKAAHETCLNCHLKYKKKGEKKVGPTECTKCHSGKYKTIAELQKIPRPNRKQKDTVFVAVENARMKGVTFDHRIHQMSSGTCRSCHHETLKPCKECHTMTGKPEGNWVNIANAYHRISSDHSCAGCHKKKQFDKNCAGCHSYIPAVEIMATNPKPGLCATCHTGKQVKPAAPKPLSTAGLNPDKVKKEISIKILEGQYEPVKFPHREIIDKLVKISNGSKMATYFHKDMETVCRGCHHRIAAAGEAQKDKHPYCSNCHMVAYDRENLRKTRLLSAYHRQCMGCHDAMKFDKGGSKQFGKEGDRCGSCHKKKAGVPAGITRVKNETVFKQNTTDILNAWK